MYFPKQVNEKMALGVGSGGAGGGNAGELFPG